MRNLLLISPINTSFIQTDVEQLSKRFNVVNRQKNWSNKKKTPLLLVKQLFYLIFNLKRFDACIVQFGGYWSFLPAIIGKLYNVPCFIIVHGTDGAAIKALNYGTLKKTPISYFIKKSFEWATEIWPVSDSLIKTTNTYSNFDLEDQKQGVLNIYKDIKTPFYVIPNGLDFNFWNEPSNSNGLKFITVVSNKTQFERKGIDVIIKASQSLPNCTFTIVGMLKPGDLNPPNNIHFIGRKSQEELKKLYSEHTYYIQLSTFEGFGLSLCEAMLCGCIPVVSNVNVLPQIIGDSGYILDNKSIASFIALINSIANQQNETKELSNKAVNQIRSNYSIENRMNLMVNRISHFTS